MSGTRPEGLTKTKRKTLIGEARRFRKLGNNYNARVLYKAAGCTSWGFKHAGWQDSDYSL